MTEVGTYVMALAFIVIPFMMMLPDALEMMFAIYRLTTLIVNFPWI